MTIKEKVYVGSLDDDEVCEDNQCSNNLIDQTCEEENSGITSDNVYENLIENNANEMT